MTAPIPYAGLWPAMLTPLTESLAIDIPAFAAHAKNLLATGCAGVTPFGTTGEGPSFSVAERQAAVQGLVDGGVPAGRILVSTSCAALPDTVALTRHATQLGARGCLVLPPFFLKGVPEAGVIDYYSQLVAAVDDPRLRIVLYHIPQVSGVPLTVNVIRALRERFAGTFIALKDSGCQRADSLVFAQAFMPDFQVWVGNEPDLQTLAAAGAVGAVSGVGNIAPGLVQRLIQGPKSASPQTDQRDVLDLLAILGGYGLTAAFKSTMATLTGHAGWRRVRAPLVALDDAAHDRLAAQWQAYGLDRLQR
ncbi:dihydrodipicolinate synthase family protein [Ideonella sp. DXS22W]|uniref:Dihydrodipicolinate synthase family protein n=1 Tax=Pseudaquabacterium inlustre TaxID=2984192 RepID=A0ABU9CM35_9BURK